VRGTTLCKRKRATITLSFYHLKKPKILVVKQVTSNLINFIENEPDDAIDDLEMVYEHNKE
jgi:hypothetical protein